MRISRKFSDEELTESIRTGKDREQAIKFIYKDNFETLSRFILNNSGNRQDAEDIFQEVVVNFIAAVQLNKFRGESSIKTFLYSLNRFSWLNELKKKGRTQLREIKYEKAGDKVQQDGSRLLIEKESADQIINLVDLLGENCKKILLMFYYDNFSMKEILDTLDYENEQVVRNKKYKCLKQLERKISDNPLLKENLKSLLNVQ